MLETGLWTGLAWFLLAAQSHRFRREAEVGRGLGAVLRMTAALALLSALCRSGDAVAGERYVRLLAAGSASAATTVLLLSFAPGLATRPVRLVSRMWRPGGGRADRPAAPDGSGA